MARTKDQTRGNDALQGGVRVNVAEGQDAREFGQGGQTIQRPHGAGEQGPPDRGPEHGQSTQRGQKPPRSNR